MRTLVILFSILTTVPCLLTSQSKQSTIAQNLRKPAGLDIDQYGRLWLAESGTGHQDGQISVLFPDGNSRVVVQALPSSLNTETGEVEGPVNVQVINEQQLAVFTGKGSDPHSGSILIFSLDRLLQEESPATVESTIHVISMKYQIQPYGFDESNPYALAINNDEYFITDASANAIFRYHTLTKQVKLFATLPQLTNSNHLLPCVAPVEAVPTQIIKNKSGGFLVSTFSGYPFPEGISVIFSISSKGEVAIHERHFTMITDMLEAPDGDGLYILEFGQFFPNDHQLIPNSGQVIHLHQDGSRSLVASNFGPSAGFAIGADDALFVTDLYQHSVLKLTTEQYKSE